MSSYSPLGTWYKPSPNVTKAFCFLNSTLPALDVSLTLVFPQQPLIITRNILMLTSGSGPTYKLLLLFFPFSRSEENQDFSHVMPSLTSSRGNSTCLPILPYEATAVKNRAHGNFLEGPPAMLNSQ